MSRQDPHLPPLRGGPLLSRETRERSIQFSFRLPAKAQPAPMKWLKNPFVLAFEGFVLGAILMATSTPNLVDPRPAREPRPLDSSVIPNSAR